MFKLVTKLLNSFTSLHWLILILLIFIGYNAYVHVSSPAYKYYQENFKILESRFFDFEKRVSTEFVPALIKYQSNLFERVKFDSPSQNLSSSLPTNLVSSAINFHYFTSGDLPHFTFDHHNYSLGDFFFGSPILFISPTLIKTSSSVFVKELRQYKAVIHDNNTSYLGSL